MNAPVLTENSVEVFVAVSVEVSVETPKPGRRHEHSHIPAGQRPVPLRPSKSDSLRVQAPVVVPKAAPNPPFCDTRRGLTPVVRLQLATQRRQGSSNGFIGRGRASSRASYYVPLAS